MADRYYVPEQLREGQVELTGPEAHHLVNVMRVKTGERVELFDGMGASATGEVVSVTRKSATIQIVNRHVDEIDSLRCALTLATAVPKGERFRWLIEKATELGVDRLIPLATARGVVQPRETKLDKMQQTVIAACKQSRRNRLMSIDGRTSWDDLLARDTTEAWLLVAHPTGEPLAAQIANLGNRKSIVAAIGPEGGFTDAEVASAIRAGAQLVGLGQNILRTETAAITVAAAVLQLHNSGERPVSAGW